MEPDIKAINELEHQDAARLIIDMFHRIMIHHALWFAEVKHQMGLDKALDLLETASKRSYEIQMKRLGKAMGFEMKDGLPSPMADMSPETLKGLMDAVSVNWLVNDGVWFQAVEFACGMNEAKRCNDSAWRQFSPFEARSIKSFLGLSEKPGLEGLKKALNFRLYANINTQSFMDEGPNSFRFEMNQCRVQAARKRKGLDDYPCKSGGLVEYTYFAQGVDPRIRTECIGCPPDQHPDEWFCAWRFSMMEDETGEG